MGEMPSLSFDDDDIRVHVPGADADLLRTWRFDLATFLALQERVRSGRLSTASSRVRGRLEAPRAGDIEPLPARDSTAARDLRELGLNAIARGSVGIVIVAGDAATATLPVVDGESLLELKIGDARRAANEAGGAVPVFVMTSFATHAFIDRHLAARGVLRGGDVTLFGQSVSLRLTESGEIFGASRGAPLPAESYTTCGHGDFFRALVETGAYARLRALGVETLLLSSVSNLGASLDPLVVGAFLRARDERGVSMLAETIERASVAPIHATDPSDPGDPGGAGAGVGVVVRVDGRLRAVDVSRVSDDVDPRTVENVAIGTFAFDVAKLANPVALDVHLVPHEIGTRRAWQADHSLCEATAVLPFAAVRVEREGRIGRFGDGRCYAVKSDADLPRVADLLLASRASAQPLLARAKHVEAAFRAAFGADARPGDSAVVAAPGRIKLFGDHTEDNDGLVLTAAVDRGILAVAERRAGGVVELVSLDSDSRARFDVRASVDGTTGTTGAPSAGGWERYARGVVAALRERGVALPGMRVALTSDVPQAAGMSSSTALCLAIARAASELCGVDFSDDELAMIAHRAEELIGARSAVTDAWSIAHGKEGRAMLIDCRTMQTTHVPLELPDHVLFVADTGKPRGVVDDVTAMYDERRRECAEAVRVLSELTGRPLRSLRDVTHEDLDDFADELPPVLRARAEHVVSESLRVVAAVAALRSGSAGYLGSLLNASHASLRDKLEVSSAEIDVMVDLLRAAGVVGARMSSGRFASSVLCLVERDHVDAVIAEVDSAYRRACSLSPAFWAVTSGDGVRVLVDD